MRTTDRGKRTMKMAMTVREREKEKEKPETRRGDPADLVR